VDGKTTKPIGEPGVLQVSPSPDGKKILMVDADLKLWIVPTDGASARAAVPERLSPEEGIAGWDRSGSSIVLFERLRIPSQVQQLDLATATRHPLYSITPPNPAALYIAQVLVTPDHSAYTYDAVTYLSRLYTLEGAH
jgi:hypothetical protein